MSKRVAGILIRIVISASLLTFVLWRIDVADLLATVQQARLPFLLAAFLIFQVGVATRTVRWMLLLKAQDISVAYWYLLVLNYSGIFFNTFLPTGFGGDVVKMIEINQSAGGDATGLVIVDRSLGLLGLFTIALMTLLFGPPLLPQQTELTLLVMVLIGMTAIIIIMQGSLVELFMTWVEKLPMGQKIIQIAGAFSGLRRRYLLAAFLVSLCFNLMIISVHFIVSQAYSIDVGYLFFAMVVPIISLSLLTPSIQGLGVREGSYQYLLGQIGIPGSVAVSSSFTVYAINVTTGLVGGVVYLITSLTAGFEKPISNDVLPNESVS